MSIGITKEADDVRRSLLRDRLSKEARQRNHERHRKHVRQQLAAEALKTKLLPYAAQLAEGAAESYINGGDGKFSIEMPLRSHELDEPFHGKLVRAQIEQLLARGSRFDVWLRTNVQDDHDVFAFVLIRKLGRIK